MLRGDALYKQCFKHPFLYAFAFVKMMYFECQNKQIYFPVAGFSCGRRVCKQVFKKQWPNGIITD